MKKIKMEKGITLVALIITIVVLLILAAVAINAITEYNIIENANSAAQKYSNQAGKEHSTLGGYSSEIDKYLGELNGGNDGNKEPELNQYKFYYEKMYVAEFPQPLDGATCMGIVFHSDKTAETYFALEGLEDIMFCMDEVKSGMTYETNKITIDYGNGEAPSVITVSPDGNSIVMDGITATATSKEIHAFYRDYTYAGETQTTMEGLDVKLSASVLIDINNVATAQTVIKSLDGTVLNTTSQSINITTGGRNHLIYSEGQQIASVSTDGKSVFFDEFQMVLNITGTPEKEEIKDLKGAIITPVEGSSIENIKAGNPKIGDTVEYNGYIYKYNQAFSIAEWVDSSRNYNMFAQTGWGVRVKDTTLSSYPDMESTIYGVPVTNVATTFGGCSELVVAPKISSNAYSLFGAFTTCTKLTTCENIPGKVKIMNNTFIDCASLKNVGEIPDSVIDLSFAFEDCISLETFGDLPKKVEDMNGTFKNCTSLKSVGVIPETVENIIDCFKSCVSLTGTITINKNNSAYYSGCFYGTVLPITLAKTACPILDELAATANNGNVTVEK